MPPLDLPAPLLERLGCHGAHDNLVCDNPIFAGCTPRLRDLELSALSVPLASPIYTGLVNLRLRRVSFNSPISDLLRVLEACPKLKTLSIKQVYFLETDFQQDSRFLSEPIDLLMLTCIELSHVGCGLNRNPQEICAPQVLSSIVIPPAALLHVEEQHGYENSADLDFIASHAQNNLNNIGEIRVLSVGPWRDAFRLRGAFQLRGRTEKRGPPRLLARFPAFTMEYAKLFSQPATQCFSLQLEMLEISLPFLGGIRHRAAVGPTSIEGYVSMLSSLSHLKKLAFPSHHPLCHLLLDALVATPSHRICPQLAKLYLYKSPNHVSWKRLLAVVRSRTDSNIGQVNLRKLTVPGYAH